MTWNDKRFIVHLFAAMIDKNYLLKNLACPRMGCRHVGAKVTLIKNEETSGFVGGMP